MKVIVFVIDNLYNENTNSIENFITNTDLAKVYKKWTIYIKLVNMKYLKKAI